MCLTWCNLWAERQFKEVEHLFQLFSRLVAAWWKLTTIYQTMNGIYIHVTSNVLQTFDWSRSNNTKTLFYSQTVSTHWSMRDSSEENTVIWSLHFVILLSSYCNLEYCVSLLSSNQMFVGLFGNDNPFGMPPVCAQ